MAATDSFTIDEAYGAGQPFSLDDAYGAPPDLPPPFPETTSIPGADPNVPRRAPALSDPGPPLPLQEPPATQAPRGTIEDARFSGPDRRIEAEVDARRLISLRPPEVFTSDNPEGLSLRRDNRQGAEYRAAVDDVLARYGSKAAFEQALLGQPDAQSAPAPFSLEEAYTDPRVALPDAQGLGRGSLNQLVQGVAGSVAAFPETLARTTQVSLRNTLREFLRIDRGEKIQRDFSKRPRLGPYGRYVKIYSEADEETRKDLKAQIAGFIGPIAEDPIFRLGEELRTTTAETFPVSAENQERFLVKAAGGLGSTVVFFLAGAAGRLLRLPPIVIAAGVGATVNSAATFRDALEHGATFEVATKAANFSAIIGTSEGLPVARFFDRMNKASGGRFKRGLIAAIFGGGEEAIQEGFQFSFDNINASKIAKYDPERDTFHGVGEAAGIGFTVGALLNFLGAMVGGRARRRGPPTRIEPTFDLPAGTGAVEGEATDAEVEAILSGQPAPAAAPEPGQPAPSPQDQRRGERDESLRLAIEGPPSAVQEPPASPPSAPVDATTDEAVTAAAVQADPDPSEAEKEAGNYQKGHITIGGLDITIETARGEFRSGVGSDGVPWTVQLPAHYGYVKRTDGADGEQIDVYIGPNPQSQTVWIVDQIDIETGRFDEHKVMVGFSSLEDAESTYVAGFSDGRGIDRMGDITPLPIEDFKAWVNLGPQTEAVGDISASQNALQRRQTVAESAGEPRRTSLNSASTGEPFSQRLYRGFGREIQDDPAIFAMPGTGPVLGRALYYSNDPAEAARFGPQIDDRVVTLQNPLVIDSDQQWRDLTKRAGWEFPNPFRLDPADAFKVVEEQNALRALIESMGHDGVVIRLGDEVPLRGPRLGPGVGDRTKTLTNVFGDDQVVVFGLAAESAGSAIAGTAPSDSEGEGVRRPLPFRASGPGIPTTTETVDPNTIAFEPGVFQFKSGADERGVTDRLEGVETFEPFLADIITVYEYIDGRRSIADGHQRLALAQRTKAGGQEVTLQAFILREADGITPAQARGWAASKNIIQNTGSSIDAAKVIRDLGLTDLPQMTPSLQLVKDAKALANLSDEAFGMVVADVVPAAQGAAVGRAVADPKQQVAVIGLLNRVKPPNKAEVDALIQEAIALGFDEGTQESLFGTEQVAESLIVERAKITAAALARLRKDRATFNSLVQRSGVISTAGNVLDETANQRRVREDDEFLQAVTALSTRTGPVSSALTAAAREFKGGRSIADATTDFIDTLKTAIAQGLLRRFSSGSRGGIPGQPDRRQDPAAQEGNRGVAGQVGQRPTVDVTDQGLQPVIPGAERITDRELLERRGEQPLRAKKRQKEADFGLFGDEKNQGELFSRGAHKPRLLPQAAPRIAYQLAQAARDFSPMKRLLEGAGLRLRVIDANRLGITLDDTSGRRVPALRALTKVARINGVTLVIDNPPSDPKVLEIYDNLAFRRDGNGDLFLEPGAGEPNYSVGMVGFYSRLERTIEERMPERAHVEQVRGIINKAAIKQEEIDWSDIMRWLDGWPSTQPLPKSDVLDFIRANQVRIITQPPRVSTIIEDLSFENEELIEPDSEWIQEIAAEVYFEDVLEEVLSGNPRYANLPSGTKGITAFDRLVKDEDKDLANEAKAEAKAISESRAFDNYMEHPELRVRETTYGYEIVRDADHAGFSYRVLTPDKEIIGESVTMGTAQEIVATHARENFGQAAEGEFAWEEYTEPGGENYEELLLVWANPPTATKYVNESHWENDANFIAHVRLNTREDTEGRKILFIEEVQSDWHQDGRKLGYMPSTTAEIARAAEELSAARDALADIKLRILDLVLSNPERLVTHRPLQAPRRTLSGHPPTRDIILEPIPGAPATRGAEWRKFLEETWRAEYRRDLSDSSPAPKSGLATVLSVMVLKGGLPVPVEATMTEIRAFLPMSLRKDLATAHFEVTRLHQIERGDSGIPPSAPFKGRAWHELVMKRMLRMAVDQGHDGMAWTTGAMQNERWSLGRVVDQLQITYLGKDQVDGPYTIRALDNDTVLRTFHAQHRGDLERFIGPGLTREVLTRGFDDGGFKREGTIILRPEDFVLGGKLNRDLYGDVDAATGELRNGMLGQFLNRYTKKWGAKVETTTIDSPNIDPRFRVRPLQVFPDQRNIPATGFDPAETIDAWRVYDTELGQYVPDTISTVQGEAVMAARRLNLAAQQDIQSVPFIAITEKMKGAVAEGQPLFAGQPRPANPRLQALADEMIAIAQQMAPQANLRLVRRMFAEAGENRNVELSGGVPGQEVAGSFAAWEDLITVALDFSEPQITIRHETFHHLRVTGLLNDREWETLRPHFGRWRQEFGLPLGENPNDNDIIDEEAAAYAFQEHQAGNTVQRGNIARIFNKIAVFFRRLLNALKRNGFQTFEDVFGKIESGEVGRRPQTFRKAGRERFSTGRRPRFNDNFWKWFGDSKTVDDDGAPRRVFRGDNRFDRFGPVFRKSRSDVAGFYFTTDPEIASNYAKGKPDTNAQEDLSNFEDWFTFPPPQGQRRRLNLRILWYHLKPEQQARVREVLLKSGLTDDGAFDFTGANSMVDQASWDWWAGQHRGNWLMAGVDGWLSSAVIFNEEERFGELLREMGLGNYEFDSPSMERPGVMPVYLSIWNPLDSAKVTEGMVDRVVDRANRARSIQKGDFSQVTPKTFGKIFRQEFDERRAKMPTGGNPEVDMSDSMVWTDIPGQIIQAFKDMGFDGIRDRGGKLGVADHDVWIAFEPWQIKSIFNRGTWDATKRDIRYAVRWNRPGRNAAPLFGYSFTLPSPLVMDHLRARNRSKLERLSGAFKAASDPVRVKLQDRFLSLRRIEEQIALQRGLTRLPENIDAYLSEELFHGRTGQRLAEFQQEHVEPLVELMEELGVTLEEIEQYLYARHAPERNRQIASINPAMPDGGSGMTTAEAGVAMKAITDSGRLPLVEQVAALIDGINQARLNLLEVSGLLDPRDRLQWSQAYQYYVPLRGLDDDEFPDLPRQGRGFDIRGNESRRALGRESRAKDILAYVISQGEEAIVRAEKNEVGKTFLRLVQANPNPDVWVINQVEYTRRINPKTGLVEVVPDASYKLADNVLAVKVGGQVHHVTIFNRSLARAMKNLGAESVGILTQALLKINRYLAAVNTSFNPEFTISNFTRDIQTAGVNIQEFDIEGAARKIVRSVPKAMRGVWLGQRGDFSTPWAQWFKEFADAGGTVGFYSLLDVPSRVKRIDRLIAQLKPGSLGAVRRVMTAAFTFVQDVNMAVENATRLAAYVTARESGMSVKRAASLAKNLTVNFNRKGEWASVANGLYLFYNASIQGTFRMLTALRNRRVQAVVLAIIGGHAALEILNQILAQAIQGDDGDNDWDKVSKWTKEHNIMLINPMPLVGMEVESPVAFKLPMPYGYNVFAVMGQKIGEMVMGKNDPLNAAIELTLAAINSFNPIGGEEGFIQLISPTIIDPAVEIAVNKDFAGRPIYPDQSGFGPPKPDSQLYWNSTDGTLSQWITERLNELTGGDEFEPGMIDFSPETLDHWMAFVTGAAGTFIQRDVDFTMKLINGDPIPVRQIPFARKLLEGRNEFWVRNKYFELRDRVSIIKHKVDVLRKTGRIDDATAARLANQPDISIGPKLRGANKRLKNLRRRRDLIRTNEVMLDDARRDALQAISDQMDGIMLDVIEQHRVLTKQQQELQ